VPQGANLSPVLANVYLNELDQQIAAKIAEFNKGKRRQQTPEYLKVKRLRARAKKKARQTGDWSTYRSLTKQMLNTPAGDSQDPNFRRMFCWRYADDVRRRQAA
jgi:hypothetical protein